MNRLWGVGLVVLLLVGFGGDADAGRRLAIINTGEDVTEVAKVKDEMRAEVEANTQAGVAIGIMYSRFGLFWLDIWRWDKKPVLVAGDTVWDISDEQAVELAGGELSMPFTLTVPPGLIALIVIGIGAVVFFVFLGGGKEDDAAPESEDEDDDET